MPYRIGFAANDQPGGPTDERATATAAEALQLLRAFQANEDEIRFIRAPSGAEIDQSELEIRAEQERPHESEAIARMTSL